MLTIRLTRKGKKNQPFFRVVVIDKRRSSKGGRAVEDLGYVDPLTKRKNLKKERVLYWISKGAKPSPTIHNLLVAEKVIEGKKITKFNISKKKLAEIAKTSADAKAMADKKTDAAAAVAPVAAAASSVIASEAKQSQTPAAEPVPVSESVPVAPVVEPAPAPAPAPAPETPADQPKPEEKPAQ